MSNEQVEQIRQYVKDYRELYPNDNRVPLLISYCADLLAQIDAQARQIRDLESLICLHTHFTGEPPYVGDAGVLLALKEHFERLQVRPAEVDAEVEQVRSRVYSRFEARATCEVNTQRRTLEGVATAYAHMACVPDGDYCDANAVLPAIAALLRAYDRVAQDNARLNNELLAISQDDGKVERAYEQSREQLSQLQQENARWQQDVLEQLTASRAQCDRLGQALDIAAGVIDHFAAHQKHCLIVSGCSCRFTHDHQKFTAAYAAACTQGKTEGK